MQNIELLAKSLTYIETHLSDEMKTVDIAKECACSKSTLEKMFQYVYGFPVHDYIIRRRMMAAAKMLNQNSQMSILDVAVAIGYNSNEAFSRAFKKVWNMNPSEFRGSNMPEIFPRFAPPREEGDDYIMGRKSVDITELYDLFCERKECWFVCCDIKNLIPINDVDYKAGDLAILTSMQRMVAAAGDEDIVFRIGGDEFCMLTNSTEEGYADTIINKILAENEKPINFEGKELPLSLYASKTRFSGSPIKYNDLFTELHNAIKESK